MTEGYKLLIHESDTVLDDGSADELIKILKEVEDDRLASLDAANATIPSHQASPLRPSLRLSSSSLSIAYDSNSRAYGPSSLSVPSFASSSTSINNLGTEQLLADPALLSEEDDSGIDTDGEQASNLIPRSEPGVHFHARHGQFVIVSPSASTHRVVTLNFSQNKVRSIKSHKPLRIHAPSFSPNDIVLSARGAKHIAVVRRGRKTGKIGLTLHHSKDGSTVHLSTKHPKQLVSDFIGHGHPSTSILAIIDDTIYLVGNRNFTHVWSLKLPNPSTRAASELEWQQEYSKTVPRPNTRPTHATDSPRVGLAWKNNLVVVGVEPSTSKLTQKPYTSPKPKTKGSKSPSSSGFFVKPPSTSLHSLNIWQYSVQNRTWARHISATNPPQGPGTGWPLSLHGCLAGESVACIAIGREDGTCIWSLDLHTWTWSELPALLPRGARVYAMSAIGTTVYFMGEGFSTDSLSSVVHCDMSTYEPWNPSRQAPGELQPLLFPSSLSAPPTKPPTPTPSEQTFTFNFTSTPLPQSQYVEAAASFLPSYDATPVPINRRLAKALFFTPYEELHLAPDDAHFEKIKNHLVAEWTTCAMFNMCFLGVDSAILGFSNDTVVALDKFAIRAVAVSIISSVMGLAMSAYLYWRYYSLDGERFRHLSRDALNSYAIFSIRARVPVMFVGITVISFIVFIIECLMRVFPEVVLPLVTLVGIILGLNWFIYLFFFMRFVISGVRYGVVSLLRLEREPEAEPQITAQLPQEPELNHSEPPPEYEKGS